LDQAVLDSLDKIELIRGTAAKMMGMVSDPAKARIETPAMPMLAFVSKSVDYTSYTDGSDVKADDVDFLSRLFYMQEMHKTYAGTGTVCTATAALIVGTIVNQIVSPKANQTNTVRIGHPGGVISIEAEVENTTAGPQLKMAAFARTSRRILEGYVYVPKTIFKK
jgi:hypothetical protein